MLELILFIVGLICGFICYDFRINRNVEKNCTCYKLVRRMPNGSLVSLYAPPPFELKYEVGKCVSSDFFSCDDEKFGIFVFDSFKNVVNYCGKPVV